MYIKHVISKNASLAPKKQEKKLIYTKEELYHHLLSNMPWIEYLLYKNTYCINILYRKNNTPLPPNQKTEEQKQSHGREIEEGQRRTRHCLHLYQLIVPSIQHFHLNQRSSDPPCSTISVIFYDFSFSSSYRFKQLSVNNSTKGSQNDIKYKIITST